MVYLLKMVIFHGYGYVSHDLFPAGESSIFSPGDVGHVFPRTNVTFAGPSEIPAL